MPVFLDILDVVDTARRAAAGLATVGCGRFFDREGRPLRIDEVAR